MRKYLIGLIIVLIHLPNVNAETISSIYTSDPFINNIIIASTLLKESRELGHQGKSIKAENKRNEAIKLLNQTIKANSIISINDAYKLKIIKSQLEDNESLYFELFFNNENLHSIIFIFSHKLHEVYDNFKNKNHLTNLKIAEKIQEGDNNNIVATKLKIVPATEYSVSKTYQIDDAWADRGVSIIITTQVLDFFIID